MAYTMTIREALAIQAEQLEYYGMKLRYRGRKQIIQINRMIPRGTEIESKFIEAVSYFGRSNCRSFLYGEGWYW